MWVAIIGAEAQGKGMFSTHLHVAAATESNPALPRSTATEQPLPSPPEQPSRGLGITQSLPTIANVSCAIKGTEVKPSQSTIATTNTSAHHLELRGSSHHCSCYHPYHACFPGPRTPTTVQPTASITGIKQVTCSARINLPGPASTSAGVCCPEAQTHKDSVQHCYHWT